MKNLILLIIFTTFSQEELLKCFQYQFKQCLQCGYTKYSTIDGNIFSNEPVNIQECKDKINQLLELNILVVSDQLCEQHPANQFCNNPQQIISQYPQFQRSYVGLIQSMYESQKEANYYQYAKLNYYLTTNIHNVRFSDMRFDTTTFFNRMQVEVTIQPLYCIEYDVPNCIITNEYAYVKLKYSQFTFQVSQYFQITNVTFDGIESQYLYQSESIDKEQFHCYNNISDQCCKNEICDLKNLSISNQMDSIQGFFKLQPIEDLEDEVQVPCLILKNCIFSNLIFVMAKNNYLNSLIQSTANYNITFKNSSLIGCAFQEGIINSVSNNSFLELDLQITDYNFNYKLLREKSSLIQLSYHQNVSIKLQLDNYYGFDPSQSIFYLKNASGYVDLYGKNIQNTIICTFDSSDIVSTFHLNDTQFLQNNNLLTFISTKLKIYDFKINNCTKILAGHFFKSTQNSQVIIQNGIIKNMSKMTFQIEDSIFEMDFCEFDQITDISKYLFTFKNSQTLISNSYFKNIAFENSLFIIYDNQIDIDGCHFSQLSGNGIIDYINTQQVSLIKNIFSCNTQLIQIITENSCSYNMNFTDNIIINSTFSDIFLLQWDCNIVNQNFLIHNSLFQDIYFDDLKNFGYNPNYMISIRNSKLTISNCQFIDIIWHEKSTYGFDIDEQVIFKMENSIFLNNGFEKNAVNYQQSPFYSWNSISIEFYNVTFISNENAGHQSGIIYLEISNNIKITNSRFEVKNKNPSLFYHGILITDFNYLNIYNNSFANYECSQITQQNSYGGALHIQDFTDLAQVYIHKNNFTNNTCPNGGSLAILDTLNVTLSLNKIF